ncbi:hypothetical protein [Streptomyces sp. NPDC059649]|uniref:hypothetical protein n=1 Tax=Streptomyces sp. NPDC059649 TaxID=3346895 RepID=UPI0036B852CD
MDERKNFTISVAKIGAAKVLAFGFVTLLASGWVEDTVRVLAMAVVVTVALICDALRR